MNAQTPSLNSCTHCRGAGYVFAYWLERMLERQGMHLTDIPANIFKQIPPQHLFYCHCNIRLAAFGPKKQFRCNECDGSTWLFTEAVHEEGYRWKMAAELSVDEIKTLPCTYFKRCSCGFDDQTPPTQKQKNVLEELSSLLSFRLPLPDIRSPDMA